MRRIIIGLSIVSLMHVFPNVYCQSDATMAFIRGQENFKNYIIKYVEYPGYAREMGIEGTVVIAFQVNKKGCIDSLQVLNSPHEILSNASIKAVKKTKCKWTPGMNKGKPVDVWLTIPIYFKLQE